MSPTMQIVMVSCWNSGFGDSHSVVHGSGNDNVCPDALVIPRMDIRHAQMSLRNMVVGLFCKINYILGLQIYHFYFVSDY